MNIYGSVSNQKQMEKIYDDRITRWVEPYSSIYVPTCFGQTHVLISGRIENPPLLLLPGLGMTSMMWLPNITVLSQFFRCYAVDIIGDFGRSELDSVRHYPKNAKQYSFWLTEILQSLKIEAVSLMGISHGGYIAANHAALMPHTINKLVLISPSAVVLTLNRVLPRIIHYLLIPSENNRRQLTEWLLGQSAATRAEYYEQIYRGLEGRPKVPIPLIIPGNVWKQIKAPLLAIFGGNDPAIPASAGSNRIQRFLPQADIVIFRDAGHLVSFESPEEFNRIVVQFLTRG